MITNKAIEPMDSGANKMDPTTTVATVLKPVDQVNEQGKERFNPGNPNNEQKKYALAHGLLSRSQAAVAVGVSWSEFRRREKIGVYTPTYIDERGWSLFSREYLENLTGYGKPLKKSPGRDTAVAREEEYRRTLETKKSPDLYEPETAAKVFEQLNAGLDADDIVMKLRIHPDAVANIYDAWQRLKKLKGGGIHISRSTLDIINDLPLPGTFPIKNEEQLLSNLREASQETLLCPMCQKRPRHICSTCAEPEAPLQSLQPPKPVKIKLRPGRPKKVLPGKFGERNWNNGDNES